MSLWFVLISIHCDKWLFCIVGLDVVRTDRTLLFYESEVNQAKLWDVLSVYAWLDNDIGYVQGELLQLSVFTVKLKAFWRNLKHY